MPQRSQTPTERPHHGGAIVPPPRVPAFAPPAPPAEAERAARASLRAQIGKLERELSAIAAEHFPFVHAPRPSGGADAPALQGLGELERTRDTLAARLQEMHARVARRGEHERAARELLKRMTLEPGRYRYYRVPVRDLGENGCGVYEVRPRFGLIGMLAGWWQVKLSSGCPLPRGSRRSRRGPAETGKASPPAYGAGARS